MSEVQQYIPRLKLKYLNEIRYKLQSDLGYSNLFMVPGLEKVVINMGVGQAETKQIQNVMEELQLITGQKPVITKAKKSIDGFKIRQGMPIGVKVTLRRNYMYEFIDRLITIALPRARDFNGLSKKSFDGCGNYAFGIKEHIIFLEIDYDKVSQIRGMDVVICTTAVNDNEALALLREINFPFVK